MGPRQTASILRAPNVLHYSQGPLFNLKKKKKKICQEGTLCGLLGC